MNQKPGWRMKFCILIGFAVTGKSFTLAILIPELKSGKAVNVAVEKLLPLSSAESCNTISVFKAFVPTLSLISYYCTHF